MGTRRRRRPFGLRLLRLAEQASCPRANWRWVWERLARYPARSLAEDALFLREAVRQGARLRQLPAAGAFVYVRHAANAWTFPLGTYLDPAGWQPADPQEFIPAPIGRFTLPAVLESQQADLCGAGRQLYYDPAADQAWLYEYPPTGRRWLAGNTLCYRKAFWARHPFPAIPIGEDTRFAWSPAATNATVTPDHRYYVGLVHNGNTSRKIVTGAYWHPHPVVELHAILAADLPFYRTLGITIRS